MLPTSLLPTTCDVYRPFGDATPTTAGVACRITSDFHPALVDGDLYWTHVLDVQPGVDIRDGITRLTAVPKLTYDDGDEVRVPSGGATRYVVVWVDTVGRGTPMQYQRVYLLRHEAAFPDP